MRTRFGILISGNGSTLQSLLDCLDVIDVTVVISSKATAYGIARARRMGIPVEILPENLRNKESRKQAEAWIIEKLELYRVEKIFLAGFMRVVSADFISKCEGRIFNVHPSLLPEYRGLDSFQRALDDGKTEAGVSVHHVVEDVDGGEMVVQRRFEIPRHRESESSHLWLHINEKRAMQDSLRRLLWKDKLTSSY